MGLFKVDLKLLPVKAHFFFSQSGFASLSPCLPIIAKQKGYSAFLVGTMFSILTVLTVLSRFIFGAITDRFSCQKKTFLWAIIVTILMTVPFGFLSYTPPLSDTTKTNDTAVLASYEFWLFFVLLTGRGIAQNVIISLTKTICLQFLGKDSHKFGMQRFCGSLGYGCGSILTGWLIDWYSYGKSIKDYRPAVMMAIVLLLTDLSIALNMNNSQSEDVSKHIFRDLKKLLSSFKIASFFTWVIFFGIFSGNISLYSLWRLEELVNKYNPQMYSSLKTLQGGLLAIKCFLGDALFFILAGKIIKKIGHINSMLIGFAALCVRFFLYFLIEDPVKLLFVELLSGLNFALPFTALTTYGSTIAPEGLKGTTQGLLDIVCSGIGVSTGNLLTGYLFTKIGHSETYLVFSVLAFVVCLILLITTKTIAAKTECTNTEALT